MWTALFNFLAFYLFWQSIVCFWVWVFLLFRSYYIGSKRTLTIKVKDNRYKSGVRFMARDLTEAEIKENKGKEKQLLKNSWIWLKVSIATMPFALLLMVINFGNK